MKSDYIYMIGVFIFGLIYYTVKKATNSDVLFISIAIVYFFSLKLIADKYGK